MKRKIFTLAIILTAIVYLGSCYLPSPLYGTWTDNAGNKIIFMQDGSFQSKIINSEGEPENGEGTYSVIDNVIVFNFTGGSINTEWDIRGALLYLTWTANGNTILLTLYHTGR